MNTLPTSNQEELLIEYIHTIFPESTSVPASQLKELIGKAWQKGLQYEFNDAEDLGIYVIATYALGENFEETVRGALRLLEDTSLTSREKADRLESLAKQELDKRENDENNTDEEREILDIESQEAAVQAGKVSADEYTETQQISQPYRQLAIWTVDMLRKGDMASVLEKFSPTVIQNVGMPKVKSVFQEKILPMFTSSTSVKVSSDVGTTRDGSGHEGYVFFMDLISPKGIQPIIVVVLKENDELVIGSLAHDERR